ncbi:MAG: SDR family oxidoreductase [Bacteroidales bacterium]|nr:SDR family oxidoreductase [Bacteroidales bacterium]
MNVLVTGVSKGLGLKITELLLKENHFVYGISKTKTNMIEKFSNEYKNNFKWICYDLSNPKDVHLIFKNEIGLENHLHGFVNNAAIAYDDIITNTNLEYLEKMYLVNVLTPIMLTKYSIRNFLLHQINGSIVHISSISVHTGYKGLAMYASTKGALEAFSKNTAREWGEKKIRSNCIVSGFMETEMSASLTKEQKNRIYQRTSLKSPVDIESVAYTVLFLLSDKAKSITGQNIYVDNGTI